MGCATSYCLKWSSLPPNEVGRIAQHVRERTRRNETTFSPQIAIVLDFEVDLFIPYLPAILIIYLFKRSFIFIGKEQFH